MRNIFFLYQGLSSDTFFSLWSQYNPARAQRYFGIPLLYMNLSSKDFFYYTIGSLFDLPYPLEKCDVSSLYINICDYLLD